MVALSMQISFAQEKTISGVVSDATGPIPGVNVIVKGTKRSTQTDFNGAYSIKANTGDVLDFSFVGMQNTSVTVGASSTANIKLQDKSNTLRRGCCSGLRYSKEKECYRGNFSN